MTEELERLVATRRIIEVSYRYASGIDLRDWDLYRTCFTDPCTFDFSSFSGRPPSPMPAQVWVDNVRSLNGNFDATQHVMTNHSISFSGSDKAVCVTELRAQHWFSPATMVQFGRDGEENWCELGGHYTNDLVRDGDIWRISTCRLTVRWRLGNESIFELARSRAATGN
jgi:hypothetical protein